MSTTIPACPSCHSESVSFNGHTRHGKQNHKCRDCGRQFIVNPLTVQMDELWSFVDDKDHDQWVWLALDAETREIVGCLYW